MAKYLKVGTGQFTYEEENPIVSSAGAADAAKIVQTDGTGRLDQSLMPVGIVPDTYTGNASGALTAGDFVYITATGTVARATAAAGSPQAADGFVLLASADAAPAVVYFEGRNTARTGLTVGARYYLSDTAPGGVTTTAPTGAGKITQYLGKAVSATTIAFEADDAILRA